MADILPFHGRVAGSEAYRAFRRAIVELKQVVCVYRGHRRELCPIVIGTTDGKEKVLTFQFGGTSSSGLPAGGEWRCLDLAEVTEVELRDGPWIEGDGHRRTQACVGEVDLDVNVHVRMRRT